MFKFYYTEENPFVLDFESYSLTMFSTTKCRILCIKFIDSSIPCHIFTLFFDLKINYALNDDTDMTWGISDDVKDTVIEIIDEVISEDIVPTTLIDKIRRKSVLNNISKSIRRLVR